MKKPKTNSRLGTVGTGARPPKLKATEAPKLDSLDVDQIICREFTMVDPNGVPRIKLRIQADGVAEVVCMSATGRAISRMKYVEATPHPAAL
jgi:hypothetical protein